MPIFCLPVGISKTGKLPVEEGLQWIPERWVQARNGREGDPGTVAQEEGKDRQPGTPLPAGIGEPL